MINHYVLAGVSAVAFCLAVAYLLLLSEGAKTGDKLKIIILAIAVFVTILLVTIGFNHVSAAAYASLTAQFTYSNFFLLASIAIIFYSLPLLFIKRPYGFLASLLFVLVLAGFGLFYAHLSTAIVAMFAIGTIFGMEHMIVRGRRIPKKHAIEINRDLVQITMGIILIALFILLSASIAILITMVVILLAYALNCHIGGKRKSSFFDLLVSLERRGELYSTGALYLAAGFTLVLGFITNVRFIEFAIVLLFFADSLATILGKMIKGPALPYNLNKTIAGTLAYFAVGSIAGYFFIGYYALLFSAIAAVIEGMRLGIDDNARIAIVLVILGYFSYL